ncbi:MAG: DUF2029 domain-containing protein [Planctomycetes bacterium]|nr:DUF2029 domain-containing protein [Planctomycetota bacterium]
MTGDPVDFLHDFVHIYWPSARSVRLGGDPVAGYYAGPFLLLELWPFALLPLAIAKWLWFAGSIFEVFIGTKIAESIVLRDMGRPTRESIRTRAFLPIVVLAISMLSSVVVLDSLVMGQLGVLASLGVLAAIWLLKNEEAPNHDLEAGIAVGLTIALKPTWLPWLLFFVLIRRLRALAIAVTTILAANLLPVLVYGPDQVLHIAMLCLDRVDALRATIANAHDSQHFAHVVQRWLSYFAGSDPDLVARRLAMLVPASLACGFIASLVACAKRRSVVDAAMLVACIAPLFVMTSWPLDFTMLPFFQAMTVARVLWCNPTPRRLVVLLTLSATSIALSSVVLRHVSHGASDLGGSTLMAQWTIALAWLASGTSSPTQHRSSVERQDGLRRG